VPRGCRYRDLVELASRMSPGDLEAGDRALLEMLVEGLEPEGIAERLGLSRRSVYYRLRDLRVKILLRLPAASVAAGAGRAEDEYRVRLRPDAVREALECDPGRVRMAADVGLRRPFSELPYCQKQVAGVNGLNRQAGRWIARDRARRRAYLTEVGHGNRVGVAVDGECRLLCRDLLEVARIRPRVRLEGSAPPPPFPEGRGGVASWLGVGDARGPRNVRWLLDAVRERLLSVIPPPERVEGLSVRAPGRRRPGVRGGGAALDVYLVPEVWVAVRWVVPWSGAEREAWEVRLVPAYPAGRMSFGDLLGEECRVLGFVCHGSPQGIARVRRAVLAPLWEDAGFERDLPSQFYWRRPGEPWFALAGDFLQVGDRVRPLLGQDAWVLLARGVKVRQLSPVAVAALTGHLVGRECLLATPGEVARLAGRGGAWDEAADCVWRYRPARRVEGRAAGRVVEEHARLERVWL